MEQLLYLYYYEIVFLLEKFKEWRKEAFQTLSILITGKYD